MAPQLNENYLLHQISIDFTFHFKFYKLFAAFNNRRKRKTQCQMNMAGMHTLSPLQR